MMATGDHNSNNSNCNTVPFNALALKKGCLGTLEEEKLNDCVKANKPLLQPPPPVSRTASFLLTSLLLVQELDAGELAYSANPTPQPAIANV